MQWGSIKRSQEMIAVEIVLFLFCCCCCCFRFVYKNRTILLFTLCAVVVLRHALACLPALKRGGPGLAHNTSRHPGRIVGDINNRVVPSLRRCHRLRCAIVKSMRDRMSRLWLSSKSQLNWICSTMASDTFFTLPPFAIKHYYVLH